IMISGPKIMPYPPPPQFIICGPHPPQLGSDCCCAQVQPGVKAIPPAATAAKCILCFLIFVLLSA
ncbi:MAG: hypothetical protein KAJ10_17025, partial [Thermodesulfovibrionia bacterium]|nr:hypothetical protein [Thermodesulfovibrionia bacterium]